MSASNEFDSQKEFEAHVARQEKRVKAMAKAREESRKARRGSTDQKAAKPASSKEA